MGASLSSTKQWFDDNGSILTSVAIGLAVFGAAYFLYIRSFRPPPPPSFDAGPVKKATSFITIGIIVLIAGIAIYFAYAAAVDSDVSGNLAKNPVEGSTTVPAANAPSDGTNWGLMFWIYVEDWEKNFGNTKNVVVRSDSNNFNPKITLEATDNNLDVAISVYPTGDSTTPANSTGSSTDTVHTLKVPNIPLQKWTAVCVSLSGRSLDVYVDGQLTRSTFLSGVPRPVTTDLTIMGDPSFSGKIMDVFHYSRALTPAEARAFFNAGTNGVKYTSTAAPSSGYKLKMGLYDSSGKLVTSFMS